jgi:hypothetical protein
MGSFARFATAPRAVTTEARTGWKAGGARIPGKSIGALQGAESVGEVRAACRIRGLAKRLADPKLIPR